MRVAFLSTYPPEHCGIAEYTSFLVEEMSQKIPVTVFASSKASPSDGRVISIPCFEVKKVDYERLKDEISRRAPFDVIHIQHEYGIFGEGQEFLAFLKDLRHCTKRVCITLHTPLHYSNKLKGYQAEMIDNADAVFVHSALAEYELWQQGVDLRKVYMVPHGTYINRMRYRKDLLEKFLGNGFTVRDSFIITIPGFIRWDKGITNLRTICERILDEFPDTKVLVAGNYQAEGKELRQLHEAIAEVKKNFKQVWLSNGFLSRKNLLKVLASSDAILLAYQEWPGHMGVSGMLHLAMGSLRPILASRVPRLVEYTERVPELCFTREDFMGLMEALRYLRHNYEKISKEVRLHLLPFVKKTSWEVTARRHLQIYEKLLNL